MLTQKQKLRAARLMSQVGDPRPAHFREDDSCFIGPDPIRASGTTHHIGVQPESYEGEGTDDPDVYVDYEKDLQTGEVFVVQRFAEHIKRP